jgi:iron complex transport system substrate-binding protein
MALATPFLAPGRSRAAGRVTLTDIVGRNVSLAAPARRIVCGAWVNLDTLALIHPDPVSLLAGWQGAPGAALDGGQYEALRRRFPGIDRLPHVGRFMLDGQSTETVLSLRPDLVLLSRYDAFGFGDPSASPSLAAFEAAGVPVVVLDFFLDPMRTGEASLRILGKAIGREPEAEAFNRFYRERLERVQRRVAAAGPSLVRPSVFLHAHASGADCCYSPGKGTFDDFIRIAGGHNIGAEVLSGPTGQLSLEYVIARDPDVYIATAAYAAAPATFAMGRGVLEEQARRGLASVAERPGIAGLSAVANKRAHGLWHSFTHTPAHIVAIEALARRLQPDLFGDVDPHETLAMINQRFLALPMEGTFWTDLAGSGSGG